VQPIAVAGQCCGDCNGDSTVTVDELVTAVNHALTSCVDEGGERLPATGQTTSYGPGSDGDVRAGATLSFTDNGDGTITDNNTGLMWEKKDDQAGGIHNRRNLYTWGMDSTPYTMNGTMVTAFLDTLNDVGGGGASCFAGHCDWRIPNLRELQSLINYESYRPAVDTAFNTGCALNCTVDGAGGTAMCSCTEEGSYWSSTTFRHQPNIAYAVFFEDGRWFSGFKSLSAPVRAVRGGL
jgi:hypothetical protein